MVNWRIEPKSRLWKMTPRMRSALGNLILVLCVLTASLLISEFVLKKFSSVQIFKDITQTTGKPMVVSYSDYLQFTLASNLSFFQKEPEFEVTYKINNLGYRGTHPQQILKPEKTKRLLVLGDSFTFGWGNSLENTFVQQLEDALGHQPEQRWEVINAGYHAGHSPDSYYAYLLKEGLTLQPDIVVIVLYSGNDIWDIKRNLWLETNDQGASKRIQSTILYMNHEGTILYPDAVLERYLPWNYRIPFLRNSYNFIAISQLANQMAGINKLDQPFIWKEHSVEEGWDRFKLLVSAQEALSQASQHELFYVLISHDPTRQPRHPDADARFADILSGNPDRNWFDLRPYLGEESYYQEDGHFNPRGNAIAAEKILEFLRAHSKQIKEGTP
jgi:lysophospholipase L1-like esterase